MLHALATGVLCAIGAFWGQKLYRWLCLSAVVMILPIVSLKAQVFYGDTAYYHENRASRGWFWVDTAQSVGWRKVDQSKPWVEQIETPLAYWDWWRETAACQGVSTSYAQFKRYRFFAVNRQSFGGKGPLQIGYYGYHLTDSMAIYVARSRMNDRDVLTHEMSHALQYLHGWSVNHSYRWFGPLYGCRFGYVDIDTADKEERR